MANNDAIYNAVIAGAGGANQERWITSTDPAAYASFKTAVEAVAAEVDADIAPDSIGASQQALMQSICQGVFAGRFPTAGNYTVIAGAIVALYTSLAGSLFPDVTPGGAFDPIYRELWLDTSKPDGGNGSIGTPYNTWADAVAPLQASGGSDPWLIQIAQDVNVSGEPLPNIGAGGHDTGCVKFQGVLASSAYGTDSTTLTGLEIGFQDGGSIQTDFENILVQGLTFGVGVDSVFLTGNNARIIGISQSSTVSGYSHLVNCSINGVALDSWNLRMNGGTIEQDIQINDGDLDGVEFLGATTFRWLGTLTLTNCRFQANVQLQCSSSQPLIVDLDTWGSMRAANVTFPDTAPTLTIIPWMPIIANLTVVSTDGMNPGDSVLTVGQLVPAAEPDSPCITSLKTQVNSNLSVVGSFIDPSTGALNVIIRNTAGTTQNLTNPTYTVTYLPRVTP